MPAKNDSGMLMTRAQGQEITRNVRALYIHVSHPASAPNTNILTIGGIMARATAAAHTAGVYTLANFDMKSSDFDFLELAFSTRSSIFDTVDSPNSFVVFIFRRPVMFMHPLIISSPSLTSLGRLSPVRALVLRLDRPSITTPSMGTFSPGRTIISLPISTSSGSIFSSVPLFSILA